MGNSPGSMSAGAQPNPSLPTQVGASAPAKAILFGEHATLYGQPAVAVALELRLQVTAAPAREFGVNRYRMRRDNIHRHRQIAKALELYWPGGAPGTPNWDPTEDHPVHFTTRTQIPSASGLGSSSAYTVASLGALEALGTDPHAAAGTDGAEVTTGRSPEELKVLARRAWEVEWQTHGKASPLDTACATLGGAVLMNPGPDGKEQAPTEWAKLGDLPTGAEELWRAERGGQFWQLASYELPAMQLVVGYSGTKSRTGVQVAKVARFAGHSSFARDILSDIGEITRRGLEALSRGELARVGALMKANHDLLTIMGVSTPEVTRLYEAASRHALGAKITGAGGGGSIIALLEPDDAEGVAATVAALQKAGGRAMVVQVAQEGLKVSRR